MNYESLHPENILINKKIYINKSVAFIVLPDTNLKIYNEIYNTNFLLSNCIGLISPNKVFTIGRKKFDGRKHYLDVKKNLEKVDDNKISKKLRVYSTLTIKQDEIQQKTEVKTPAKFIFYDASIWSQAVNYLLNNFSERTVAKLLFNELQELYKNIKSFYPTFDVDVLLLVKNREGVFYNIITKIRTIIKKEFLEELKFFDNFLLLSDCEKVIIPIMHQKEGKVNLVIQNINKLEKYIEQQEEAKSIDSSPVIEEPKDNKHEEIKDPKRLIFSDIASKLTDVKIKSEVKTDDKINIEVNQEALSKVFKTYKIKDPDIIANVKTALDEYLRTHKVTMTRDKAEKIVLNSIYYTLYGKDESEIPIEVLEKPHILFEKLKEFSTYKVPLNIPDNENSIINYKDVIDLKYTTGQFRQKFEFETTIDENISKLFSSLENISNQFPIKIKKIEKEIIDNNSDRYINYKVTLQNLLTENKKPYQVELKVPALVNDKYFKIHGNYYIMSNQQFLKPVTKTDRNEVRLISNYGIVRVGLGKSRFNPTEITDICNYVKTKYPNLIKNLDDEKCEFSDGSIVYFNGNEIYKSKDNNIVIDPETNKLYDKKRKQEITAKRYELIYDIFLEKISLVNPEDNLSKSKKILPYIWIYLGSIKMPLILYQWSQKGLLSSLNDLGVDYELKDKAEKGKISIPTKDNKFLIISLDQKDLRKRLILNGLQNIKFKKPIEDLNNPEEIYDLITELYGSRTVDLITNLTANFVDPVTKELLQFENFPTNLVSLASTTAVDQLLNKKQDSLSDLKVYRVRLSEIILNLVYKQIRMAQNTYRINVLSGKPDATLFLDPDYVISNILTSAGVLQQAEPVNPVHEIMLTSRVIKTGKGGIPSKRSSKREHRNIHPSQYGTISACSTPEYYDVGLVTHHTLTPVITNKYGSYGFKNVTNEISGWQVLALDESLTPFQNQVDSDRLFLARTHANQVIPVINRQAPYVRTGAEAIVPQLASSRFVIRAPKDGQVVDIIGKDEKSPNKVLMVKYSDGETQAFDISPRLSRTKRGSYVLLEMQVNKTKFKANDVIASTHNFSEMKDDNGLYCSGTNAFVAVMNYMGYNHEDSYVISKRLAEESKTYIVDEISVIVPPNTKIVKMVKDIPSTVNIGDSLVEFTYDYDIEDYLKNYNPEEDTPEEETEIFSSGDNTIKRISTIQGEVIDIKIFINNKTTADKVLINLHKQLSEECQKRIDLIQKTIKDKNEKLRAVDNINTAFMNIGNHKHKGVPFKGVKVVYYIKYTKPLREGDKMSNRYGAKGVISKILDAPPKGEFTPQIDVFISPSSVLGRKNIAMIKELYLGKIFYYANEKLYEMANDPKITNEKLAKFIIDLYQIVGPKKIVDHIASRLEKIGPLRLRQLLKNKKFTLFALVEPFQDIPFENIKEAAEFLKIPLDEKVYIPELDSWTDVPVPVGVSYYLFLEHFSNVYASVRGAGKYVSLTKQPTKKKSQGGGQTIGRLDIYALLTYDAENILTELLSSRSDEHKSKRSLYNAIVETGELQSIEIEKIGGTRDVFNIYLTGLGLQVK